MVKGEQYCVVTNYDLIVVVPVNNDWIRGCVILVATGSVLQTPATYQFVRQQNSSKVRILASSFVSHQLRLHRELKGK